MKMYHRYQGQERLLKVFTWIIQGGGEVNLHTSGGIFLLKCDSVKMMTFSHLEEIGEDIDRLCLIDKRDFPILSKDVVLNPKINYGKDGVIYTLEGWNNNGKNRLHAYLNN